MLNLPKAKIALSIPECKSYRPFLPLLGHGRPPVYGTMSLGPTLPNAEVLVSRRCLRGEVPGRRGQQPIKKWLRVESRYRESYNGRRGVSGLGSDPPPSFGIRSGIAIPRRTIGCAEGSRLGHARE